MIRKVCEYIKQNNMIEKGDRIVVGVSGGADSVCLLYVFFEISKRYEAEFIVVHVNHGIRGRDAELDEQFVANLCNRIDIEYHCYEYDVIKIAKEEGLTEEEAGRNVRYQAFFEVGQLRKCNRIAIAHNKNDVAETVLFNLFRGTGIKGLSGIDPIRKMKTEEGDFTVIRPLLCVERQEIEEYLGKNKIPYQTDSSNLADEYSRNKIRNQILTYVTKELNHNATQHIVGAAAQLKETGEFVNKCITQRFTALVDIKEQVYFVTVEKLQVEDIVIQKGIVRKILEELTGNLKDLEAKHVELVLMLCQKQVGKHVNLPYDVVAQREYNTIKIYLDKNRQLSDSVLAKEMKPIELKIPGELKLSQYGMLLKANVLKYDKNVTIPKNSCTKWFDYDKIENAVVIRTRNEGDYIQINRFGGRKKIKDYFIDQKIPCEDRNNRLLLSDGSHIMWILGDAGRISEKYKVEETTKRILSMKLIDVEEDEKWQIE